MWATSKPLLTVEGRLLCLGGWYPQALKALHTLLLVQLLAGSS